MIRSRYYVLATVLWAILPPGGTPALADSDRDGAETPLSAEHSTSMTHSPASTETPSPSAQPTLAGQYAFATIAEVVDFLERDPSTDWSRVDLESLRQHLIDMSRVTLGASVASENVPDGARFRVTSLDADTVSSIRRMTIAHAATADPSVGAGGVAWRYALEANPEGATLVVQGNGPAAGERIRALGFIGILVAGTHHPVHHLAIARGERPHNH